MLFARYSLFLLLLVFYFPLSMFSQNSANTENSSLSPGDSFVDNVHFDHPEGYVDKQFRELAQEYIQPKVPDDLDLILGKEKKLTPETLQRLVDLIAEQVSQKIEKKIYSSHNKSKPYMTPSLPPLNNESMLPKNPSIPLSSLEDNSPPTPRRKVISVNPEQQFRIREFSATIPMHSSPKLITSQKNSILNFSLSGVRNKRININKASNRQGRLSLSHASNIRRIKLELIARKVGTSRNILLKSQNIRVTPQRSLIPIQMSWNLTSGSLGSYKMIARASFYDNRGRLVSTQSKFWGSPSSSQFVVIAN